MNATKPTKALSHEALDAMSTPDLLARLEAVKANIAIIRFHIKGCPYYLSIDSERVAWNQGQYERRTINKILARRAAHVAASEAALEHAEVGAALAEV